jgi:hypothetical protein
MIDCGLALLLLGAAAEALGLYLVIREIPQ